MYESFLMVSVKPLITSCKSIPHLSTEIKQLRQEKAIPDRK